MGAQPERTWGASSTVEKSALMSRRHESARELARRYLREGGFDATSRAGFPGGPRVQAQGAFLCRDPPSVYEKDNAQDHDGE